MYTGGDSSGEGFKQLNSFGLANISAPTMPAAGTAIDWASLAQQWIQMQDNQASAQEMCNYAAAAGLPEAPPPPNISGNNSSDTLNFAKPLPTVAAKKYTYEEQGEADMDISDIYVEEDGAGGHKQNRMLTNSPPPPAPSMTIIGETVLPMNLMSTQQQLWYNMQQTAGLDMGANDNIAPQAPAWNAWQSNMPTNTPAVAGSAHNPTAHIPSLLKLNVPHPNVIKAMPDTPTDSSSYGGIDAAKRKTLPAWLREGLEKLEREKQKQLEREQTAPATAATVTQLESATALATADGARVKSLISNDLESDNSGKEDNEDAAEQTENFDGERRFGIQKASSMAAATNRHKNKAVNDDDIDGDSIGGNGDDDDDDNDQLQVGKSYEQKLADLMFNVRRTLTELLLEVTNEEIANIAHDSLKNFKTKGLADYDDSSSESESENDSASNKSEDTDDNVGNNSEEELKATIRQKRRAFAKISEEIDDNVAANALREEEKLKYYTQLEKEKEQTLSGQSKRRRESGDTAEEDNNSDSDSGSRRRATNAALGKNYERHFGETSSDTKSNLSHPNGKQRQRERLARKERTTRFSDNKDPKGSATFAAPTTASAVSAAATFLAQQQQQQQQLQQQQQTTGIDSHKSMRGSSSSSSGIVHPVNLPSRLPDANGLYTAVSYGSTTDSCPPPSNLSRVLNAAEATLEKVANRQKPYSDERSGSSSRHQRSRGQGDKRHRRSSNEESSDSSDSSEETSTSTTSNSSRGSSKYSRTSTSRRHKRRSRSRSRTHSRSQSHRRSSHKRDNKSDYYDDRYARDSGSSRRHRHHSSDSDDYDKSSHRHHRSKHSSSSSSRYNHHHRKSKSRSRSKSRSSHTSSSKQRH